MAQNKLDDWTAVEIRTYDYVRHRCRTHGKTAEIRMRFSLSFNSIIFHPAAASASVYDDE